jgi:hypothetical protein
VYANGAYKIGAIKLKCGRMAFCSNGLALESKAEEIILKYPNILTIEADIPNYCKYQIFYLINILVDFTCPDISIRLTNNGDDGISNISVLLYPNSLELTPNVSTLPANLTLKDNRVECKMNMSSGETIDLKFHANKYISGSHNVKMNVSFRYKNLKIEDSVYWLDIRLPVYWNLSSIFHVRSFINLDLFSLSPFSESVLITSVGDKDQIRHVNTK